MEEARSRLQAVLHDAAIWQQLDVLSWGYVYLMQVELARGDWSAAQQALREIEQLVLSERFGAYQGWLPTVRAQWRLAQGQIKAVADWAAGVVLPEAAWEDRFYGAFPVLVRAPGSTSQYCDDHHPPRSVGGGAAPDRQARASL